MKYTHRCLLILFLFGMILKQDTRAQENCIANPDLSTAAWKYRPGFDSSWLLSGQRDLTWTSINPASNLEDLSAIQGGNRYTLSTEILVNADCRAPLFISVEQSCASAIYLDGQFIVSFGKMSQQADAIRAYDPKRTPIELPVLAPGRHHLVVVADIQPGLRPRVMYGRQYPLFWAKILTRDHVMSYQANRWASGMEFLNTGIFLLLFFIHFFSFLVDPSSKLNAWYSLYPLFLLLGGIPGMTTFEPGWIDEKIRSVAGISITTFLSMIFLAASFVEMLKPLSWKWGIPLVLAQVLITITDWFAPPNLKYLDAIVFLLLGMGPLLYISYRKMKQGNPSAKYVFGGVIVYLLFFVTFLALLGASLPGYIYDILFHISLLSIPLSISMAISQQSRLTQLSLARATREKEKLILEKAQILENENQALEQEVAKRTEELVLKNRDLEVEAALEKVRGRSLAMHHSDEIRDVIGVTHKMLGDLHIRHDTVAIQVFDFEEKSSIFWPGNNLADFAPKVNLPFDEAIMQADACHRELWEAMTTGIPIHNKVYTKEQKDRWFKYIFEHNDEQVIPNSARHFISDASSHTVCFFPQKNSGLFADSWDGSTYNAFEQSVLERTARVFEQAYVRFLDLKKAEAQAREAQIEVALEKVRSRSLAMHHSDELEEVVACLFDRLVELGLTFNGAGIYLFDKPNRNMTLWVASRVANPVKVDLPYDAKIADNVITRDLWKLTEDGVDIRNKRYAGPEKDDYYRYVGKYNNALIPEQVRQMMIDADEWTASFAAENNCALMIDSWEGRITSDEDFQIVKRFARVFDQAYVRFIDLQKSEYQAREAQVEAALERVRSRTAGMQRSEELKDVVKILYDQLNILGFQHGAAAIIIMDSQTGDFDCWASGVESGYDFPECYHVPYFDHWWHHAQLEHWEKGEKYTEIELAGNDKKVVDEYYFHFTDFKKVPSLTKQLMMRQASILFSMAFTKSGALAWSPSRISSEQATILQRFATVFDQTYTRFQDLQRAEYQAREAVKQASLDRVRGEIASMRSEQDLDRITPLIWTELQHLGIRFSRCGIFIVDVPKQEVNAFLSTPDGKAIAALDLDFRKINLEQVVEHWHRHERFVTHWSETAFTELAEILVREQIIGSQSQYLASLPRTGLYLHYIPFLQGMLYVAHTESLREDELGLVQSLADSFSVAYARYEDFTSMESAKLETEHALNELKQTQAQLVQSEKMASLGELTAGIAHEIQNPLNFVNNFSDLNRELIEELKEELSKGDIREAASIADSLKDNEEKINLHGRRADGIVKSMLQHSRSSSGQKEPTDVNKLVDEYVRLAYHGFRAKHKDFNVKLDLQLDPALGRVPMVAQDIGRVILNLLNNAFQAVQEKAKTAGPDYQPTVCIKTQYANEQSAMRNSQSAQAESVNPQFAIRNLSSIAIAIEDNGPGIADNIKDKIFQPFFTTKPTGQGTGLGLSLSYDIVKAHGGVLSLHTKNGEGTEFIVQLPIN
jgi:signal transduction histidine kinase/frataxin-like iron-binding protein CyaY